MSKSNLEELDGKTLIEALSECFKPGKGEAVAKIFCDTYPKYFDKRGKGQGNDELTYSVIEKTLRAIMRENPEIYTWKKVGISYLYDYKDTPTCSESESEKEKVKAQMILSLKKEDKLTVEKMASNYLGSHDNKEYNTICNVVNLILYEDRVTFCMKQSGVGEDKKNFYALVK